MSNPFYIPVQDQITPALSGLSNTIGQYGQMKRQQQAQQEAQQEIAQGLSELENAFQNNDYDALSKLSIKYPQMGENALKTLGAKNARTKENAIDTLFSLNVRPDRADDILQEREDLVISEGGDPIDTQGLRDLYREDPEQAQNLTKSYLALAAPDRYEKYKKLTTEDRPDYQYKDGGIIFDPLTGKTKQSTVKPPAKKPKLKEVKGGVKYFDDGSEQPIGQSEQVENPVTGKRFTPSQAQAVLSDAKEFQLKNGGFAITLDDGLKKVDRMYKEGYDPTSAAWTETVFGSGVVSNLLKTEEDQVFMGSIDEMINSIARRETGAAITEFERKDFFNRYMPRAGDSPKRLKQKRNSLERQLKSIAGQSGGVFEALQITGEDQPQSPQETTQDSNVVNWSDL